MSKIRLLCACLAMLPVTGCTAVALLDTASRNIFLREDVNLVEKNYAAADYLAGLTRATVNKIVPIEVGSLQHANQIGMSSAFGEVIPNQIGARFAQLGYNVVTPLDDASKPTSKRTVLLTGTYLPSGQTAEVNLRLVEKSSGRLLGAYDYAIPINYEISDLLEPRPVIIRTTPGQ